jgi:hypothetical protein
LVLLRYEQSNGVGKISPLNNFFSAMDRRFLGKSKFLYHPAPAEPSVSHKSDESKPQIDVIFGLYKLIKTSETQHLTNKIERLFGFVWIDGTSFRINFTDT